jgi:hypothetical protein
MMVVVQCDNRASNRCAGTLACFVRGFDVPDQSHVHPSL